MRIKTGVTIAGLRTEAAIGLLLAIPVYMRYAADHVLTSGLERAAGRVRKSKHHVGLAFDLRTQGLGRGEAERLGQDLRDVLGEEFDVVVHDDHVHVEFDPPERL